MTAPDWTFAGRPVWIVGHLVALLGVSIFVMAGVWQLDRHDQRQALEAEIDERLAAPVVDLGDLSGRAAEDIRFREVTVTGTFDPSEEVMLVLQSLGGVSGHHVLTPLVTSPTQAVIVDRGWVPFELDQPGDQRFAPPAGQVTLTGYVRSTQIRGRSVPDTGELTQIGRVDVERLQRQIELDLAPVFIQLTEPVDTSAELPRITPLPALDDGPPHLAYAVQWYIFAAVVVIGYAVLMYRTSRAADGRENETDDRASASR